MMYLTLILINFIVVMLWDYLNWPGNLAGQIAEIITDGKIKTVSLKKPWGCSICITIILSLLYLFIFNELSLFNIFYFTFLSVYNGYLTQFTLLIINTLDQFIEMILINLQKIIDKIIWK